MGIPESLGEIKGATPSAGHDAAGQQNGRKGKCDNIPSLRLTSSKELIDILLGAPFSPCGMPFPVDDSDISDDGRSPPFVAFVSPFGREESVSISERRFVEAQDIDCPLSVNERPSGGDCERVWIRSGASSKASCE